MNLTDQLREHAEAFFPGGPIHDYISDAADRIEALEAALREVESLALVSSNTYSGLAQAGRMAREALGESS